MGCIQLCDQPETEKFANNISILFCVVQGVTVVKIQAQVRDWAGQCQSATVVVSSANSQQAGHDPPPTVEGDGADTKGVLHTCPDNDARTPEI